MILGTGGMKTPMSSLVKRILLKKANTNAKRCNDIIAQYHTVTKNGVKYAKL
jgi:hypothetical protein